MRISKKQQLVGAWTKLLESKVGILNQRTKKYIKHRNNQVCNIPKDFLVGTGVMIPDLQLTIKDGISVKEVHREISSKMTKDSLINIKNTEFCRGRNRWGLTEEDRLEIDSKMTKDSLTNIKNTGFCELFYLF